MKPSPVTAIALPTYALVSPARNEEATLEATIQSVVSQTVLPLRWVIVSDGSTDRTEEIAEAYCREHEWIRLLPLRGHGARDFAAKVEAFNAGYRELVDLDFDIVGNLDADITFDPDYFEYLLGQFSRYPHLGVAGTPFVEEDGNTYDYRFTNIEHVTGMCQLFRHRCFIDIGGYVPLPGGGIDWVAVTTARMKGWMTFTFADRELRHHRKMGTGTAGAYLAWYVRGRKDYALGGHPVWQIARSAYQMTKRPRLVGGTLLLCGYFIAAVSGAQKSVSKELLRFNRREQLLRLRRRLQGVRWRPSDDCFAASPPPPLRRSSELNPGLLNAAAVRSVLDELARWVEEHGYRGYEPFDGLSSPFRMLTGGSLFLERVLTQTVRRSPLNLRPLLGIRPLDSTIARGYMARGYLLRARTSSSHELVDKAHECFQWLMDHKSPECEEYAWGKHFDFASRAGRYPKLEPITVWTAIIALAFLDGYDATGVKSYLHVAESSCRWISRLSRHETEDGACVSYTGTGMKGSTIHNHNMLAAALLARTAALTNDRNAASGFIQLAAEAMAFSCSAQHRDGSWYYGEEPKFSWIDNFHTGYNLDALRLFIKHSGYRDYVHLLERGLQFYIGHFFEPDGAPRYYPHHRFPVDIQCVSQSIDTLSTCSEYDPRALPLAQKVTRWALVNMRSRDGHFHYRRYRGGIVVKTPMLHWGQATMYAGLGALATRLSRKPSAVSVE